MNKLYFGDNLDILKELYQQNPNGFIDLIYIDPPFNSKRDYNVLFENVGLEDTKAQKEAFADTWANVTYIDTLNEIQDLNLDLYNFLKALENVKLSKGAVSYLTIMSIRLWYMHKLLKDTGSFYLHCDPTMSHYLKIICDLVFREKNFQNEIIWCYDTGGVSNKRFSRKHDLIYFYSKSNKYKFYVDNVRTEYKEKAKVKFKKIKGKEYLRKNPKGKNPLDWWMISPLTNTSKERLGYPTQKPEALLERIIKASSKKGDVVADFFCGCGTTISVAEKLKRKWIGTDISHLAVKLITKRLQDSYGEKIRKTFEIFGFPKDIASAKELATGTKGGRLKFEEWIIEVMLQGVVNSSRTQAGYDGYLTFQSNKIIQKKEKFLALIEVKSGKATLSQLNHFIKTIGDKKADMGLFICFEEQITSGMQKSAKQQGYFEEGLFSKEYDKIQLISVESLLENKLPKIPVSTKTTFKTAQRKTIDNDTQIELFD